MASHNLVRTFVLLWWTLGLVLLFWSIETARGALESSRAPDTHVAILGAVEAVAALLFLVPRTLRIGAIGLVCTLAIAFIAHTAQHELRLDLLIDAAAVLFVAVHGPVPLEQLRPAA